MINGRYKCVVWIILVFGNIIWCFPTEENNKQTSEQTVQTVHRQFSELPRKLFHLTLGLPCLGLFVLVYWFRDGRRDFRAEQDGFVDFGPIVPFSDPAIDNGNTTRFGRTQPM